jgi:hypothetical protein
MSDSLQKIRRAPAKIQLSAAARRLRAAIIREFAINDPAGLAVLQAGLEALDRMRMAQRHIAEDGAVVRDCWSQLKPHPLLPIERDSRAAFRQLGLDLEPLNDGLGRPAGRGSLDE